MELILLHSSLVENQTLEGCCLTVIII